ncbi:hypothetical protein GCM10022226_37980 [Sphaerisporangium flaviroseum]|uniref:Uncharacterized protein n=1 Tax=Sphaerisporangium flaviroseum TaxID=509199 RepID=A0ABP7IAD6_9ACTN
MDDLESLVIARRLRVPADVRVDVPAAGSATGWGEVAARQLDAALLSVGFTCSAALLERLARLPGAAVVDLGVRVLAAVRRMVGDHVRHNVYFIDFPRNVPDTLEFWAGLLRETLLDPVAAARIQPPTLDLLTLPSYGRYQHAYTEPRTVRTKSDLRGSGRIALPLVFLHGGDGGWRVKWLHLYLKGRPGFNQVEGNRVTASLLVRSIVERDYLRVGYLADLLRAKASSAEHTTYIGLEAPAGLPPGSRVYTPGTLHELIPA